MLSSWCSYCIGGGFYAWGEFNTRLSAIEGAGVDISAFLKTAKRLQ